MLYSLNVHTRAGFVCFYWYTHVNKNDAIEGKLFTFSEVFPFEK